MTNKLVCRAEVNCSCFCHACVAGSAEARCGQFHCAVQILSNFLPACTSPVCWPKNLPGVHVTAHFQVSPNLFSPNWWLVFAWLSLQPLQSALAKLPTTLSAMVQPFPALLLFALILFSFFGVVLPCFFFARTSTLFWFCEIRNEIGLTLFAIPQNCTVFPSSALRHNNKEVNLCVAANLF